MAFAFYAANAAFTANVQRTPASKSACKKGSEILLPFVQLQRTYNEARSLPSLGLWAVDRGLASSCSAPLKLDPVRHLPPRRCCRTELLPGSHYAKGCLYRCLIHVLT